MDNKISINLRILNNSHDENYMPYPNLDYKYGPYKSLDEAKNIIDSNSRSIGLTIGVITDNSIIEYWWKSGIEDENLVPKISNNNFEGELTAEDIKYENNSHTNIKNVDDALNKLLNKVYYVALSLTDSSGGDTFEKGSTQDITIEATFNKVPDRIIINGDEITPSETISKTYNNVDSNQTYTLTAYSTNAEEETIDVTKKFYATFVNKKYYGVSSKTELTSSEINDLKGVLDADRKGDFTVNAGDGEYIFFAIPSTYGTPAFKVGGFDGGFDKVDTISHTNESGHKENYDVYRSTNASLGDTTVTVN